MKNIIFVLVVALLFGGCDKEDDISSSTSQASSDSELVGEWRGECVGYGVLGFGRRQIYKFKSGGNIEEIEQVFAVYTSSDECFISGGAEIEYILKGTYTIEEGFVESNLTIREEIDIEGDEKILQEREEGSFSGLSTRYRIINAVLYFESTFGYTDPNSKYMNEKYFVDWLYDIWEPGENGIGITRSQAAKKIDDISFLKEIGYLDYIGYIEGEIHYDLAKPYHKVIN